MTGKFEKKFLPRKIVLKWIKTFIVQKDHTENLGTSVNTHHDIS
jgi:hypothetical protein